MPTNPIVESHNFCDGYHTSLFFKQFPIHYFILQGPVVRRLISANPGLNFNPGLFFFSSKAFSWTIFSIRFRVPNHQIVDKKN